VNPDELWGHALMRSINPLKIETNVTKTNPQNH